jgi:hypothetical protein
LRDRDEFAFLHPGWLDIVLIAKVGIPSPEQRLKSAGVVADRRDVDISAIALQGLEQAQVQLQTAATRLASAGLSSDGYNLDSVDLSAGIVALMSAKNNFSVNASLLKTADEIQKTAINLMA